MVPERFRVTDRRRETADTWTLELERSTGGAPGVRAPASSRCCTRSAGRGADLDQRRPGRAERLVHTVRAVGAVTRGDLRAPSRGRCWGSAARSAATGRSRRRPGTTSSSWPAASASRRCGRSSTRCWRARERFGRALLLYGGREPEQLLYDGELERWRRARARRGRHRGHRAGRLERPRRRRAGADRRAPPSTRPHAVAFVCGPEVMMRFAAEALIDRGVARRPRCTSRWSAT